MVVRFQTFEQIHNRKNVGSTKIRVHNLIKNWPGAELYKYGEKPEVMIFQKVYITQDYKFPEYLDCIKILDICDPDWLEGAFIRQTIDAVDAITCPTKPIADFIRQMTDKPVKVIKDRFDLTAFPSPKVHTEKLKTAGWFGYSHNIEPIKYALPSFEKRKLKLLVVADGDPQAWSWAEDKEAYKKLYEFRKWQHITAYHDIQKADVIVFPPATRPKDRFKSENKTTISRLLGIPVVSNAEQLDKLVEPQARNDYVKRWYNQTKSNYDVKLSVKEYKELINELQNSK